MTSSLGMGMTAGSFALKSVKGSRNAVVVDHMPRAGFIIIAKTNFSV